MADDMGYGDPQCMNRESKVPTPNINKLAVDGVRFLDAHAPAAVCVPTRYGLLSGRYPMRMAKKKGPLLEPDRMTIASLLKNNGYATGCVGKWHLGFEHEKQPANQRLGGGPVDHGFDYYYGIPASLDIPPYYYIENDRCVAPPSEKIGDSNTEGWTRIQGAFWRGGGLAPGYKHDEVLDRFSDKSVEFLEKQTKDKPFFLYLALAAPHTPWLPSKDFDGTTGVPMYGDFVSEVDHHVGRVLQTLERLELADDTLVIFTSDNGPVWYPSDVEKYDHSSTGFCRGMKGDTYEGGHRMPFIVRWPGKVGDDRREEHVICHTDIMATLADLLDVELPKDAGEDSFSFLPQLTGKEATGPVRESSVYRSSRGVDSIRKGPWKLIPALGSGGFTQPSRVDAKEGGPAGQLFNLVIDPEEVFDVYAQHPKKVAELTELLGKLKENGRSR